MKNMIGIANELFEYNLRWQRAVLFLFFFTVTTIVFQLMKKPNLNISEIDTKTAIDLISEKLNLPEKKETLINKTFDKIKDKYNNSKSNTASSIENTQTKQETVDFSVDNIDTPLKKNEAIKPTSLDILNDD